MNNNDVLFSELAGSGGDLGIITLNRPSALNALNLQMIQAIHQQLLKWETNSHIKAVIIRAAEGRAFCAGGDLRLTYQRLSAQDPNVTQYFREEYALNHCIYHYQKPYIALLDGITFGGGVGISIHGSHRVATERLLFAMPETGIGFFPDVGGTYFLPRLPAYTGFYLGLTGARMNADECVQLGITQHKVSMDALSDLVTAIAQCQFGQDAHADIHQVIEKFNLPTSASAILKEEEWIEQVFSQATVEEIWQRLSHTSHAFAKDAFQLIQQKSPTSLKVTLRAMQHGAQLNFDECMEQEYRLVSRFLLGHDFAEGIRAVIIDKDQKPQWRPTSLDAVSNSDVEKYFASLPKELFQ